MGRCPSGLTTDSGILQSLRSFRTTPLEFTQEEIHSFAMENAAGILLATISFLKSKGTSVEECMDYVGKQFAKGWESLKGKGALEVTRVAVLNWVSCGATLVSLSGNDTRAEAVIEWPPDESAQMFGITVQDGHKVNNVFVPISKQVGLNFTWKSEGDQFRITFSR